MGAFDWTGRRSDRGARWAIVGTVMLGIAGCPATEPDDGDGGLRRDAGADGGTVAVTIHGELLLANGYPNQLVPLFRAGISSGSALARVRVFARFCADAACATPLALEPVELDGEEPGDDYVPASASTTGVGFAKAFTIRSAPVGTSYVQLVGDTEYSRVAGLGSCTGLADCPADFDVLSSEGFQVSVNNDGHVDQPAAAAQSIVVPASGGEMTFAETFFLGHLFFDRGPLATEAPSDDGTLLVAVSNAADSYRNLVLRLALDDTSTNPGGVGTGSYTLQRDGADFAGDLCAFIRGDSAAYAIGVDDDGAHVFALDLSTGAQQGDDPIVTIPPGDPDNSETFAHPCRGVYGETNDVEHLYLVEYAGAGSRTTSSPSPFYDVNLTAGTYTNGGITNTDYALRALAIDGSSHLFAIDMSWSQDAQDETVDTNRILELLRDADGNVTGISGTYVTDVRSDEKCDSTLHWSTGARVVTLDGESRLLVGHDLGVAVYDVSDADVKLQDVLLPGFGRTFTELEPSPDGTRLYAMPNCKAINTATTFKLPYGAGEENADTNLVAILDLSGSTLGVATTTIDVDADGTPDHGVDIDFYRLKSFIRAHGTTLPIPPIVYTGGRLAVGSSMLFVRGTGIQGNGTAMQISSSGMGQVQDVGFFDLATGHGVVLGPYLPWIHGLSSEAGTSRAIWGYDVHAGRESSVGALLYLPAP